ncbi:MAG: hypothetical protein RL701_7386, partial [Pseudomonadota bacterium]
MNSHPVVSRLTQLSDQWASFVANTAARVLVWQLSALEEPMLNAFLELESDETTAEHPDVFLTMHAAFSSAESYGSELARTLANGCDEGRASLRELELPYEWALPAPAKHELDWAYLARVAQAFASYYALEGCFVFVLRPSAVADSAAFQAWLSKFAEVAPDNVRAIVIDAVASATPLLSALPDHQQARVVLQTAALRMPLALQQLSAEAGQLDTPGGQFRDLFVRMSCALSERRLDAALPLGAAALKVARDHALWHLTLPVHLALGTACLSEQRGLEALEHYRAAEADAQHGMTASDAHTAQLCQSLCVKSRVSHGAAL